ncbi:MAG: ASKHA domain-containing protein [Treponema sp.]|nr:ASKHA domain-containing protein [Treponema sp.]
MIGTAIDIGTTTIQAQLVDLNTGSILDDFSALNDQRSFGTDVMSRISAAQNLKLPELYKTVNSQTENILKGFINKNNISVIDKCIISGNTTMLHLFCNIDPSAMGKAPYTPVFLQERRFKGTELSLSAEEIILLPGISAFIGADVTAGLALIEIINKGENALFADIGTNGEIAVWKESEKKLLCCSAAAGPCFEESEISCGLRAPDFIDEIARMRRSNEIDETGALTSKYSGGAVTQKDVRQFQLAKSAICSGIKAMCRKTKLNIDDFGAIYIAGGIGFHLNIESAAETGLLPKEFAGSRQKIKICGNTSLKGAVKCLTNHAFLQRCSEIIKHAETIDLAVDKYFAAAFEYNISFNK